MTSSSPSSSSTPSAFSPDAPTREDIDRLSGPALVEFGTNWCGHCQAAKPLVEQALKDDPVIAHHYKVEDGKGRPLGRSFGVTLWPTLVFLRDGKESGRLVRPQSVEAIRAELRRVAELAS